MTPPKNGITPEVIREVMPPYELSADLLAAAFASIPPPPPGATQAWREARAARLVQEIAGLMPANAPQARIAAQILIARQATDDSFARVNTPGLTVEQICRLRRTGNALMNSAAVLERLLARHQQSPVPFFGTVLPDAIDVPVLAAAWGGAGLRPGGAGEAGASGSGPADGPLVEMAWPSRETSVHGHLPVRAPAGEPAGQAPQGEGLSTKPRECGLDGVMDAGPDDGVASGRDGGGSTDRLVAPGMTGSIVGTSAWGHQADQAPAGKPPGQAPQDQASVGKGLADMTKGREPAFDFSAGVGDRATPSAASWAGRPGGRWGRDAAGSGAWLNTRRGPSAHGGRCGPSAQGGRCGPSAQGGRHLMSALGG